MSSSRWSSSSSCRPTRAPKWYEFWCAERLRWYVDLGIPADLLRLRAHDADELSHYSAGTSDVEFLYPWGWGELEGIANRTDFDLTQHSKHSGQRLEYFDQTTNEHYVPHVIEPAAGATRAMMAFLLAAYDEDEIGGEARTVLRLHPRLAPYKVAVLPLSKKDTLTPLAREVLGLVQHRWMTDYDDTQSIGRRYRRQDEIGTPLAVTVDFESLEDRAVTIRDRDTTEQVRVPIDSLVAELHARPRRRRSPLRSSARTRARQSVLRRASQRRPRQRPADSSATSTHHRPSRRAPTRSGRQPGNRSPEAAARWSSARESSLAPPLVVVAPPPGTVVAVVVVRVVVVGGRRGAAARDRRRRARVLAGCPGLDPGTSFVTLSTRSSPAWEVNVTDGGARGDGDAVVRHHHRHRDALRRCRCRSR